MVNQHSVDAVNAAEFNAPFIRPLYDTYGFNRLPQTIIDHLTGSSGSGLPPDTLSGLRQRYDTVIVFFADAFGWRFYEEAARTYPFLQHFAQHGVISKLTSQFPSTTAAHVTCMHTGLAPAQSGVYEWYQYEPSLNALIAPLLFSYAGELSRDTLVNARVLPSDIFPRQTIYHQLAQSGAKSYVFQSNAYARSAPSQHLLAGARIMPYRTLPEALVQLSEQLATQDSPSYYLIYFSNIDSIGHEYGPESAEIEAEIDSFHVTLERLLLDRLLGLRHRTLFVLTADHGQVRINPQTTLYLNREERLRDLRRYMDLDRNGDPLVPAGSSRDLFLHIKPNALDQARTLLAAVLSDHALVMPTSELIAHGFFGPQNLPVSPLFLQRVGNLVILPYTGESVYWYSRGRFEQTFHGHHGGLTREEMEIPFLACEL